MSKREWGNGILNVSRSEAESGRGGRCEDCEELLLSDAMLCQRCYYERADNYPGMKVRAEEAESALAREREALAEAKASCKHHGELYAIEIASRAQDRALMREALLALGDAENALRPHYALGSFQRIGMTAVLSKLRERLENL